MHQIDELENIKYIYSEGGRPLTLRGLEDPDKIHYFRYSVNSVKAYVGLLINYQNKSVFWQGYPALNDSPPKIEFEIILPTMKLIEKEISKKCGIANLQEGISEGCNLVYCKDKT